MSFTYLLWLADYRCAGRLAGSVRHCWSSPYGPACPSRYRCRSPRRDWSWRSANLRFPVSLAWPRPPPPWHREDPRPRSGWDSRSRSDCTWLALGSHHLSNLETRVKGRRVKLIKLESAINLIECFEDKEEIYSKLLLHFLGEGDEKESKEIKVWKELEIENLEMYAFRDLFNYFTVYLFLFSSHLYII